MALVLAVSMKAYFKKKFLTKFCILNWRIRIFNKKKEPHIDLIEKIQKIYIHNDRLTRTYKIKYVAVLDSKSDDFGKQQIKSQCVCGKQNSINNC